jgi:hypothetical protein
MSVGTSGSASKYLASTQVDLKDAAAAKAYEVYPALAPVGTTEALQISYSAGGATAGAARVELDYVVPCLMPKLPELLGTLATQFQIGIGGSGLRRLRFRNGFSGDLEWNPTADRVLTLPDSSGTIARLSDITSSGVAAYPLVAVTAIKTLALSDNLTYQNCTNGLSNHNHYPCRYF